MNTLNATGSVAFSARAENALRYHDGRCNAAAQCVLRTVELLLRADRFTARHADALADKMEFLRKLLALPVGTRTLRAAPSGNHERIARRIARAYRTGAHA